MSFEVKSEDPTNFGAKLLQGFLLSPCLFIISASALNTAADKRTATETTYMDHEVKVQLAPSQIAVTRSLQKRLDQKLSRVPTLHIKYSTAKSELMHLVPMTNKE